MSKFEWMELETLSSEITQTQTRLDAARATKNLGLVQLLERELADALKRRAQVLANITKGLGYTGPQPKLVPKPGRQPTQQPIILQPPVEKAAPQTIAAGAEPNRSANRSKGADFMWDKLTAGDLERVKRGLATRRSEILARHAEEL